MPTILATHDLTKYFRHEWTWRPLCALQDVNLCIEEGEVLGLIGHNGAGKTTTFKLLMGLLRPSRGDITWRGGPLNTAARTAIGFLPEQPYFYEHLAVRETLDFYASLYGLRGAERRQRVVEVMEQVRVTSKRDAPMRTLSKGTLQRVGIAQAIMNRPRLVVLDEPMSGLDPAGRKEMRDLILSLKRDGTTVLFSSHILSDAEALCDRVAILAGGRLREVVDLESDRAVPLAYTLVVVDAPPHTLDALSHLATTPLSGGPQRWSMQLKDQATVQRALAEVQGSGASVEALSPLRPSLEQRFLRYVHSEVDAD